MKSDAVANELSVSQVLAKGACPICGVLKEFQSVLADKVQIAGEERLCNFHTWLLARGAPAENVVAFYLKMLDRPSIAKVGSSECDFCRRTLDEENARLHELVQYRQRALFLEWMKNQASLCLDHARKLEQRAPLKLRPVISEIVERTRSELKQELGAFLEQAVPGTHAGGGILGRTAEFLVSQRGL
jgi:hypothetical protein